MLDFARYKNTDPYISESECETYKIYVQERDAWKKREEELKKAIREELTQARNEWRDKSNELARKFKADALAELGLSDHPKADRLYNKAWEIGHGHGFSDVFHYLEDFSELIREQ